MGFALMQIAPTMGKRGFKDNGVAFCQFVTFTFNHEFHRALKNKSKLLAGMYHTAVSTTAALFDGVKKDCKIWITQPLRQANNLMFVFKEKNGLALAFFGVDDGRAFLCFLDKVVILIPKALASLTIISTEGVVRPRSILEIMFDDTVELVASSCIVLSFRNLVDFSFLPISFLTISVELHYIRK